MDQPQNPPLQETRTFPTMVSVSLTFTFQVHDSDELQYVIGTAGEKPISLYADLMDILNPSLPVVTERINGLSFENCKKILNGLL